MADTTESQTFGISVQQHRAWRTDPASQFGAAVVSARPLEEEQLRVRLGELISAHEVLRTSFDVAPGRTLPDQVVKASGVGVILTLGGPTLAAAFAELAAEQRRTGGLAVGIMDETLLVVGSSLMGDARSATTLLRQLLGTSRSDDPLQYVDYSGWQAEELADRLAPESSTAHWDRPTTPHVLELRAADNSSAELAICSEDLMVDSLGVADAVAAWMMVLRRLAADDTIQLDLITSGRDNDETTDAVGPYEALHQLHSHVPLSLSIEALADKVSGLVDQTDDSVGDLKNEQVRRAHDTERGTAIRIIESMDTDLAIVAMFDQSGGHAITLTIHPGASGPRVTLAYQPDFMNRATVRVLAEQFRTAVGAVRAGTSDASIDDFNLVDEGELERIDALLASPWSLPPEHPETVLDAFHRQVSSQPESICVLDGQEQLTFAEVNARSNRIASTLQSHGVSRDSPVGIYLERSVSSLVAVLATLKAGGAYLPLDLDTPSQRLQEILGRAQAVALIADVQPEWDPGVPVITERGDTGSWLSPSFSPTDHCEDLAYIIPTSGTTGLPKLVAVTRHAVSYLNASLQQAVYARIARDGQLRVALNGPLTFDTSVKQWIQIAQGHALVVVPAELRFEPIQLLAFFDEHAIDVVDCTPSQLQVWLDHGLADLPNPPVLLVGGEPVPPGMWESLAASDRLQAFNLYGPTECTVDTTVAEITSDIAGPVIGWPLPHLRVSVLDSRGRPQPAGAIGELTVAGDALARGYLADPEATEASFGTGPEHAYRTGDLVSIGATGALTYHGRSDRQLKIRGFRIEPGDVEATLTMHPGVASAVVTAVDSGHGERLVAYWVARKAERAADTDLREHLKARLPDYLQPQQLIEVPLIPLTRNGKVDFAALPAPESLSRPAYSEPSNERERIIATVWEEVLDVERVGRDDGFAALGGDSIQSIQAVSLARRRGLVLTPAQVFRLQTVAALGEVAKATDSGTQLTTTLAPTADIALTPIQHRFFNRNLDNPNHWNQSMLVELQPGVTPAKVASAVEKLLRAHPQLSMRYTHTGGRWVASQAEPQPPTVTIVEPGDEQQIQLSLNISQGPLIATGFIEGDRPRLLIVIHHLVVDAVSWAILASDLETALSAEGESGQVLGEDTEGTSYATWAEALAKSAASGALEGQVPYWSQQTGSFAVPEPAVAPPPGMREHTVTLEKSQTVSLLRTVDEERGLSVVDLVTGALAAVMHTGDPGQRLAIDCEAHGREPELVPGADLSRTVGWYTAVYPQALSLSSCKTFRDAVNHVRERRESVPTGGVGYGMLRYLHSRAKVPTETGAEIMVNYLGRHRSSRSEGMAVPVAGATGEDRDPSVDRGYALEIDAVVTGDQLRLYWSIADHRVDADWTKQLIESVTALLAGGLPPRSTAPAGDAHNCSMPIPSSVQYGLLEREQRWPRFGQHLYQWHLEVAESVDPERFDAAWTNVIDRHQALRTVFLPGQPATVHIDDASRMASTVIDLRGASQSEVETAAETYLRERQRNGLNLTVSPPIDLALLLHDAGTAVLATFSLLAVDVTSFGAALSEAWQFYRDENLTLPPPAENRFARWTATQDWAAARSFWTNAMAGVTAPQTTATRRAPVGATHRAYRELVCWLSQEETDGLLAFARSHALTPNTILQGLWGTALSRHCGRSDVVFGSIVDAAAQAQGQGQAIGRFVNFLPVHIQLDTSKPLPEWLGDQQDRFMSSLQHAYVTAEQVQRWCDIDPSERLFDSLVAWEVDPFDELVDQPHWPHVTDLKLIQDPDLPLKLTGTLRGRLRVSLAYLPDQVDENEAKKLFEEICTALTSLRGPLSDGRR